MTISEIILTSLTTTGILGGLFVWLFKESLKTSLKLDLEQRLNLQKADLDRIRDSFQFQIQQAMLSIQLKTAKTHEVYPELYEKLKVAEGSVGRLLGLRTSPTWEEYTTEDLKAMMIKRNMVYGKIDDLIKKIEAHRTSGLKEMNEYLRMLELHEAEGKVQDAKNYLILKSLYLTDEISEDCFKICTALHGATVDANPSYDVDLKSYRKNLQDTEALMNSVKVKMRAELSHKELPAPSN